MQFGVASQAVQHAPSSPAHTPGAAGFTGKRPLFGRTQHLGAGWDRGTTVTTTAVAPSPIVTLNSPDAPTEGVPTGTSMAESDLF